MHSLATTGEASRVALQLLLSHSQWAVTLSISELRRLIPTPPVLPNRIQQYFRPLKQLHMQEGEHLCSVRSLQMNLRRHRIAR